MSQGPGNAGDNLYSSPQGGDPPVQLPQPMPPGSVPNYLVQSILLLVCCAGIFAIPAIIYAAQVNGKLQSGDYAGAVQASENAKEMVHHRAGLQHPGDRRSDLAGRSQRERPVLARIFIRFVASRSTTQPRKDLG